MKDLISEVRKHLPGSSRRNGLTTGAVRSVSSTLFRTLPDKSMAHVLDLCDELLSVRDWALGIIAYDWAWKLRAQYDDSVFPRFERWLKEYVTGWGDCDDLCTHAFGAALAKNNDWFSRAIEWTTHPSFSVRRASAVILIYPIRKGLYQGLHPFRISDILINDEHYLVQKGYGWMLKVLSETEPHSVYEYLAARKAVMPRVAFRYALEKLDSGMRADLMKK